MKISYKTLQSMFFSYFKVNKSRNSKLIFWSGIAGNSLDHYDSALYVFLAPFLAPIFFPESDPLVALILIYGIKSIGFIIRPLGSTLFGYLALKHSPQKLLSVTLTGVAISTFFIGVIPSYEKIGIWAPVFLVIIRAIQGIFAAGEYNIAALFILEHVGDKKEQVKASSFYICSTMAGTLLASFAASVVSLSSKPTFYWRIAFLLGLLTAVTGLILRLKTTKIATNYKPQQRNIKTLKILSNNKWKLLKIIPITSFSFLTYVIPFIFLNNFIPLFSDIKTSDLLIYNTFLLALDILMIPVFGHIANKFNIIKWMATISIIVAFTIIPIFYILPQLNLIGITIAKLWIIILGVAFVAPLNVLLFRMIPTDEKYLITGFGYSVGTELLGRSATTICLSIWYYTHSSWAPAIYVAFVAICASLALLSEIETNKNC